MQRTVFIIDNSSYGMKSSTMWSKFAEELGELDCVRRVHIVTGAKVMDTQYIQFHDLQAISANLLHSLKRFSKPNSIFIFTDARDPLVFMIRQQSQIYDLGYKFIGFWNDGTWDQNGVIRNWLRGQDYRWGTKLERALIDCYDYNFTPRESQVYHISKNLSSLSSMTVQFCPLPFSNSIQHEMGIDWGDDKEDIILLNSQPLSKHNKTLFDSLQVEFPDFKFMSVHELGLDTNSYYRLLKRAKIVLSTNSSEVNAFSIVEAMVAGCVPVIPDIDVYSEVIPSKYQYSQEILRPPHINFIRGNGPLIAMIQNIIDNYSEIDMTDDIQQIVDRYYSSEKLKTVIKTIANET